MTLLRRLDRIAWRALNLAGSGIVARLWVDLIFGPSWHRDDGALTAIATGFLVAIAILTWPSWAPRGLGGKT